MGSTRLSSIQRFQASNRILMGLGYSGADQRHHQTLDCWRSCRSSQSYNRQPTGAHEDSISGKARIRATCFFPLTENPLTHTYLSIVISVFHPWLPSRVSFLFVDLDQFFCVYDLSHSRQNMPLYPNLGSRP